MIPEAMEDVRRREDMQDQRCQFIIGYQKTQLFVSGCNRHQIIRNWCVIYRMLFTLIWCIAFFMKLLIDIALLSHWHTIH